MYHHRPVLAMKRANPFSNDVPVQCKFYVSEKEADKNCQTRMSAVHSKTLKMLYSGSNQHNGTLKPDRGGQVNGTTPTNLQSKPCVSCHRKCVAVSACSFCDRSSCEDCTRPCVSCEKVFCPLCSVLKYNQHKEYAVCLSCGS